MRILILILSSTTCSYIFFSRSHFSNLIFHLDLLPLFGAILDLNVCWRMSLLLGIGTVIGFCMFPL